MPCRFTGLFHIESTSHTLTIYFLNETSCIHALSMNYFQDIHDADLSSFPAIYTSIAHHQVYLITGNMIHHPSKPLLVYPQFTFMCILKAELDATYHGCSCTFSNLEFNGIWLFGLPSHRHCQSGACPLSNSK